MRTNPYTPGAGVMPAYLAGREKLIENAEGYLASIVGRYPQQSVIYYGLRGVGKTVLLNRIETAADNLNILYAHIEANENPRERGGNGRRGFTERLVGAINRFAHEISMKERARDFAQKCIGLLRSFRLTYSVAEGSFGLGTDNSIPPSSGDYESDLTDILVQLGKAALQSGDTICIFVDEVQYLSEEELGGLISAIHRCNQLRLPVMVFCAGLPKVLKTVGEAYSYSERLFKFERVDALTCEDARDAICEPAKDFGVSYAPQAVERIMAVTGGYPYFIQQLCNVVWRRAEVDGTLTLKDVEDSETEFFSMLDDGFFSVRYERCTPLEKSFMAAMVKCGELPCTIANVAKLMGRSAQSISPLRAQLINKGMIYATGHGEIDFTVPQFDHFILRQNPALTL